MTITVEREASVTLQTLDGETRTAETRRDGSWQCPFCQRYNYPAATAEEWQAVAPCADRWCIAGGAWDNEDALKRYRKREAEAAEAKAAADALSIKRHAVHDTVAANRDAHRFAWACTHQTTIDEIVKGAPEGMCEASGSDRAGYVTHVRGHGAKALHPSVPPIKLRRKPPAATLRKLPVLPFKWLSWTETHREPKPCGCGHGKESHGPDLVTDSAGEVTWVSRRGRGRRLYAPPVTHWTDPGCTEDGCSCTVADYEIRDEVTTVTRRGQFWADGPRAGTVWVLPFEPAPWESGHAAPVTLDVRGGAPSYAGTYDPAA